MKKEKNVKGRSQNKKVDKNLGPEPEKEIAKSSKVESKIEVAKDKNLNGISKAIYIIASILKVVMIIAMSGLIAFLAISLLLVSKAKFDAKNETITILNHEFSYKLAEGEVKFDKDVLFTYNVNEKATIDRFVKGSKLFKVCFLGTLIGTLIIACFALFKMFSYLEKLFKNIYFKNSPFSYSNALFTRKIALYFALSIFIPDIILGLLELVFKLNLAIEFNMMNYLIVLIILAISYVFKYGYEVQENLHN